MAKKTVAQKRAELEQQLRRIKASSDEAIREIEEQRRAEAREVKAQLDALDAATRAEERKLVGEMAIELGLFLLQNGGVKSKTVQAIVRTPEFDAFMSSGGRKRSAKRALFGLVPGTGAVPAAKSAAS